MNNILKKILFPFFIMLSFSGISQSLEGIWHGEYTYTHLDGKKISSPTEVPINLKFILNEDSSYTIYSAIKGSNAKGLDTTVITLVSGQFSKDSIYLEELEVIAPKDISPCLQKMALRINRKENNTELKGTWKSEAINCFSSGYIWFKKLK